MSKTIHNYVETVIVGGGFSGLFACDAFIRKDYRSFLLIQENKHRMDFTEGLSVVFQKMAKALKPGHPLAFTYHHNNLEAYYPIAVAMLDSGLVCSASLPCPAEMGASIHISGTGSSIVDTVFVCRSTGSVPAGWLAKTPAALAGLVREDVAKLREAGLKETRGDVRCIIYGHLIRLAVWSLRHSWDKERPVREKTAAVVENIGAFGGLAEVEKHFGEDMMPSALVRTSSVREETGRYGADDDEISFKVMTDFCAVA